MGISLECATFVETKKHDYMDFVAVYNWFVGMLSDPMTAYLLIVGLMAIESSFIPFPSEIVVPPAAYFAVVDQNISIYMVVVLATIGAILGALVNYGLSVWLGRPIVYKFANSRLGHICLIDQAKVEKAEKYFDEAVRKKMPANRFDIVLVVGGMTFAFTADMMKQLRQKQSKARFILYQWDSEKNLPYSVGIHPYFDAIYTFDRQDALRDTKYKLLPLFYTENYKSVSDMEQKWEQMQTIVRRYHKL